MRYTGVEANFAIGRVYAFREEWENARRYLGLALEAKPDHAEVLGALAQVDAKDGRLADSYARVRAARDASPNDPALQVLFGELSLAAQRPDDAEAAFRRAIEVDPNHMRAYTNLAGLFVATGRGPQAIETYQKALEQNPKSGSLHLLLASLLANLTGAEAPSTIGTVWQSLAASVPVLAGLNHASIPATGVALDATAWKGLPFVEGKSLKFDPTKGTA